MSTITQEQYDELLNKVKLLEDEVKKYHVQKEWYDGIDSLQFKSGEHKDELVEFEANHASWKYTKENKLFNDAFVVDVYEANRDITAMTTLSLEQMKQLRDYLIEKIDYLES